MFQLRKRLLYKSEGHNHSDNQASSDDKTKSGDHRDKSTVKPLTATVANISSLRTLRSVAMTSQKASPDHGHLSTVSAPTRSYKRLGTSSPLFSVKRRRTNLPSHAPSPIMASVAVASRSSPLPLSTRPTTPASHSSPKDTKTPPKIGYALPKSVFEDLDDDQQSLVQRKGSSRDLSAQAMMAKGHKVQHKLRAAQSNLERSRINLEIAQDELTQAKTAYHNWRADIFAETEKATTIRESLQLVKRHKKHYAFLQTLVKGGPLMTERLIGAAKDAGLKFETGLDFVYLEMIVCVMLSLAQHRRDDLDPSRSMNYRVHLLVSKKGDTTHAHVFDAEFPKSVLDELDEPSHHEKATWPAIYHTRVPYEPYDTFASRITSHLVRDKHSLRIKEAGTGSQCIPKKRKFGQELPI
ncbi:unnamed protein product [Fusarium graminearum]|uniref:Chromosome 4, complete genome n=1 Tax=Gibberella zeae (strain ATCC MYA-4620 / CBS 123657 / FGSC 9075 / NRRL 31084 / PH-1) TaxID=229533 RepID=A0A098DTU0_GIBZE|nr:unnamed protein product [Fusarium graminearum]CEF84777.1 unnamed protein product [Fusarium graminearum]